MQTLNEIKSDDNHVHLLLISPSKAGKSTYAAEAAIDGFRLIYVDSDNGQSAVRSRVAKEKNPEEILGRIHYVGTNRPRLFLMGFLRSTAKKPLLWVPRLQQGWSAKLEGIVDSDDVYVLNIKAVPSNYVLVVDSWTALAQDALQQLRPEQSAPLLDGVDQQIYGEAKANGEFIANMLQSLNMHVFVQAHDSRYEIYEKPKNITAGTTKQKDMVLIDTITVPISTSRVAGLELVKRFNHVGWLEVAGTGMVDIDFTRSPKRVGGGPPNRKERTKDLTFRKLVEESGGAMPDSVQPSDDWFRVVRHGDLIAAGAPTL